MKKYLLAVTVLFSIVVSAQKSDATAQAKAAFAKAYPKVTKIDWENEDGNYEASFEQNGKKMSVIYNAKGALVESELEMNTNELLASVTAYMKEHYKGVALKGAAKITKADGSINYEAAIKGKDVLFDANGKFIKEVKD